MNDDYDNTQTDRAVLARAGTPRCVRGETTHAYGQRGVCADCGRTADMEAVAAALGLDFAAGPMLEADGDAPAEGWRIRDLDELNRVLGRMARLERLREENRELVAKEVARKQEWLAKEDQALERRYRDLAAHVEVYARDNREALGKTRRLPNGTVAWREQKEGFHRLDPAMSASAARKALLEWSLAEERARGLDVPLTESKPALDLERVKEYLRETGVRQSPPPGLEWVGPGESLSIVVVKEKP